MKINLTECNTQINAGDVVVTKEGTLLIVNFMVNTYRLVDLETSTVFSTVFNTQKELRAILESKGIIRIYLSSDLELTTKPTLEYVPF